jgi:hypothetical protein
VFTFLFLPGKWGVLMIAAALKQLPLLASLDISSCGLTPELLLK